jgi:hypothetical protein
MMVDELNEDPLADEGKSNLLGDSIRKALLTGMSAVLMTEEGIRSALADKKLPKEAMAFLAQQADKTRRELMRAVADEILGFVKGIDVRSELRKALVGVKMEVRAQVRFVEDKNGDATMVVDVQDATIGARARRRAKKTRGT